MNDKKIRKLVLAALLAALVCVATMVVQIPSPMQGYVNLGDCFVLLSGWLLGPWYGFAAGGIGSMLADIFLGYAHYAPGTLVIKGVMALVAALMYEKMGHTATSRIAGGVVSEIIMVLGYFGYASLLLGKGLAAAASIPGNIFQGVVGLVVGVLLVFMGVRSGIIIALSLAVGLGVSQQPLILQFAPDWLKNLLSSGIAAGGITAIVLNLIFPPEKA